MASILLLLKRMVNVLKETLDDPLKGEINGLELTATLPTTAESLPTIVVSFDKVERTISGLGSIVVVENEIAGVSMQVVKRDRITGQMTFQIWFEKDTIDVLIEIEAAAELLGKLLETNKNNLRAQGLLKQDIVSIGPVESSENLSVWLIPPGIDGSKNAALGKELIYNFVYEDMEGEAEDDRIIEKIVVEPIKVNGNVVPENASVPADS